MSQQFWLGWTYDPPDIFPMLITQISKMTHLSQVNIISFGYLQYEIDSAYLE